MNNRSFETPLSMAIETESWYQCTQLLLDAGGDITIPQRSHDSRGCFSALESLLNDDMNLFKYTEMRFVDVGAPTSIGLNIWLYAFHRGSEKDSVHPGNIPGLLKSVCDINETTKNCPGFPDGWNCVFFLVLDAEVKYNSGDFESLRLLLRHSVNIHAKDASGLTIFDHVNALPSKSNSYQRDLWYCAIQREGVDVGDEQRMQNGTPLYDEYYTPEDYRALCFLEHWNSFNLEEQVYDLLEQHPWTEEEWLVMQPIYQKREAERAAERGAERNAGREWQSRRRGHSNPLEGVL